MTDFFIKVWEFILNIPSQAMAYVRYLLDKLLMGFLDFLGWLMSWVVSAVGSGLDSIGATQMINNGLAMIPPTAIYLLDVSGVFEAMQILLAAMILRFFVRMIPFVGG